MPRKQQRIVSGLEDPILKLDNVPGPKAPPLELTEHYLKVQVILACHRYDDVVAACHWCCDMKEGLAFSRFGSRGTRMFCSRRCADALEAYHKKVTEPRQALRGGVPWEKNSS